MFGSNLNLPPGVSFNDIPGNGPLLHCDICGFDCEKCICPPCPTCDVQGDPKCYVEHGLRHTAEQHGRMRYVAESLYSMEQVEKKLDEERVKAENEEREFERMNAYHDMRDNARASGLALSLLFIFALFVSPARAEQDDQVKYVITKADTDAGDQLGALTVKKLRKALEEDDQQTLGEVMNDILTWTDICDEFSKTKTPKSKDEWVIVCAMAAVVNTVDLKKITEQHKDAFGKWMIRHEGQKMGAQAAKDIAEAFDKNDVKTIKQVMECYECWQDSSNKVTNYIAATLLHSKRPNINNQDRINTEALTTFQRNVRLEELVKAHRELWEEYLRQRREEEKTQKKL